MTFKFKNNNITVDDSWLSFFQTQGNELKTIESLVGSDFTPSVMDIFKIFNLPVNDIRFVIVGQDPYPQKGVATGRCFEINNDSWEYVNRSLEAILVSIYYHLKGSLISYCEIVAKIKAKEWIVFPPNRLFIELEKQSGCFFLNKSLTCPVNNKNEHKDIWIKFISALVTYIDSNIKPKWILWGNSAQELIEHINDKDRIIKTNHPANFGYFEGTKSKETLFSFAKNSGLNAVFESTNLELY